MNKDIIEYFDVPAGMHNTIRILGGFMRQVNAALKRFLVRKGIKHAQALSTFLTEETKQTGFWITNAKLAGTTLSNQSSREIITDLVRSKLVTQADDSGANWHKVYPTSTLLRYLRSTKELSLQSFKTETKLSQLEVAIKRLIAKFDPPYTEEKYDSYIQLSQEGDLGD
jgi:hypothetical protein